MTGMVREYAPIKVQPVTEAGQLKAFGETTQRAVSTVADCAVDGWVVSQ
jgi:hypothetical protein